MMQVKMVTLSAGPEGSYSPGQVVDLPSDQAIALVNGGFATPVGQWPTVETAATKPTKTAKAEPADETATVAPPETADAGTGDPAEPADDAPKQKKKAG